MRLFGRGRIMHFWLSDRRSGSQLPPRTIRRDPGAAANGSLPPRDDRHEPSTQLPAGAVGKDESRANGRAALLCASRLEDNLSGDQRGGRRYVGLPRGSKVVPELGGG